MSYTWNATGDLECYDKKEMFINKYQWCDVPRQAQRPLTLKQQQQQDAATQPSLWESMFGAHARNRVEPFAQAPDTYLYTFNIMVTNTDGTFNHHVKSVINGNPRNGDFIMNFSPTQDNDGKPVRVAVVDLTDYKQFDPNMPHLSMMIQHNIKKSTSSLLFNNSLGMQMLEKRSAEYQIPYFDSAGLKVFYDLRSMGY